MNMNGKGFIAPGRASAARSSSPTSFGETFRGDAAKGFTGTPLAEFAKGSTGELVS